MKKDHFIARRKLGGYLMLGVAALTLGSCAQDGFDNGERFTTVSGIKLESPNADSIVVTPDASGAKQTISWPVVLVQVDTSCRCMMLLLLINLLLWIVLKTNLLTVLL